MSNLKKLLKDIDPEDYIAYLGCDYKTSPGHSGLQVNIKECPRCGGDKWKVYLNAETGIGCCFHGSCSDSPGFNLFSFTEAFFGSKKQAFEELERYAKDIGWKPRRPAVKNNIVIDDFKLPESVSLPNKNKIPDYLINRGFTESTVKHFEWRYSESGYFQYKNHEGETVKQDYSKRIIIPVRDLDGEIKTFQGRDITGNKSKKYLFPPGLPGTAKFLYNSHNTIGSENIVIGEGVMDVAAIHQAFEVDPLLAKVKPVGTFGKVLSEGQQDASDQLGVLLRLKNMGLKRITFMWDSEAKTTKAAFKAAQRLSSIGFDTYVAILPENSDPNEVDPLEVRKAYKEAIKVNKPNYLRYMAKLKTY